jgi:hypothetical protein
VAENVRPPVAIRIVRPYESEEELLEHELETIGKTSVVLIGAHSRPTGVILRFEMTLASGATVLRGEGRVLAHKENAFRGQAGLTLRFTRLDPRSKAVVDRATAMREAKSQEGATSSRPAPLPPSNPDPALAEALTASTPAPARVEPAPPPPSERPPPIAARSIELTPPPAPVAEAAPLRTESAEPPSPVAEAAPLRTESAEPPSPEPQPEPVDDRPTPAPTPVTSIPGDVVPIVTPIAAPHDEVDDAAATLAPRPPARAPLSASSSPIAPPPGRDELLGRLRERAARLAPQRVEEILSARR